MRSVLGLVVFALALGACTTDTPAESEELELTELVDLPRVCTFIGCFDGVHLDLTGGSETFTGTIAWDDAAPIAIACPGHGESPFEYACDGPSVFVYAPAGATSAKVTIATDDGAFDGDVKLTFEPVYPNGSECGAVCEQARASIAIE